MEKKIIEKLLSIGVLPHTKGFGYLKRAIEITIKNNYKLPEMTKEVYDKCMVVFDKMNGGKA